MANQKHMTLQERSIIENELNKGNYNFRAIGRQIDKSGSTIAKEIRKHLVQRQPGKYNPCQHRLDCQHISDLCHGCGGGRRAKCSFCTKCCIPERCPDYEYLECERLSKAPYCCNGCSNYSKCTLDRKVYNAVQADAKYRELLVSSRDGINITELELQRISEVLVPLVKKGQSLRHICLNHSAELMVNERTLYNYVEQNILEIRNLDLPRQVRYKARKKTYEYKVEKGCYVGRTYDDYCAYMLEHPDTAVVQLDSVIGRVGGKVLLTVTFCSCGLMLSFLRDANTAASVTEIFNRLEQLLGLQVFQQLFPVILTDRGSEFSNPTAIEMGVNGEERTRVFYCDPNMPGQKGTCEVTHELIRRILPHGTSFDNLTQDDVDLMMNHINSYARKKLNNLSPTRLFSEMYGVNVSERLNVKEIQPDSIQLKPELLERKQ